MEPWCWCTTAPIDTRRRVIPARRHAALEGSAVPTDVAAVVRFLASPASQWITGQTIDATGGNRLRCQHAERGNQSRVIPQDAR
nr:SDR family oxidoreductase [Rhodococcus kyotonensis]